jgi:hypothetical protein
MEPGTLSLPRTGRTWRSLSKRESKRGGGVQDRQTMEKFEQRELKRGTGQVEHGEVLAKKNRRGHRSGRTWRS